MSDLSTRLGDVSGLSVRTVKMLEKGGLSRVADLIGHYPRRHEDRSHFGGFPLAETPGAVCLHGFITDCGVRKLGFRKYVEITVEDATHALLSPPIRCRWFNMPWIVKAFAAGQEIVLFGRVKEKKGGLILDHPDFELIDAADRGESIHMGRLVPIYALGDGLIQKSLREAMHQVLLTLHPDAVEDVLPEGGPSGQGVDVEMPGLSRMDALRSIHFPRTMEALTAARRYLAMEEFFTLQLNILHRREQGRARPGTAHGAPGVLLERWQAALPFALTGAQLRTIGEIRADLAGSRPMNRLLQGDVGSGKTFVALAAALIVAESGHRTAIMAPTQILAEQHYDNFQRHLGPLGVRIGLHTAARREESPLRPFDGGDGSPPIVIGTHALLFDEIRDDPPSLIIIDEQHKFGVAQRARLISRGWAPDVLVMTATPIPRTLALTLYGDLDVSVLDEMPAGRGEITTAVRAGVDLSQVTGFLQQQLAKGRQAYIVYSLVEESDTLTAKAASAEHTAWENRLPGISVGLLHGRLKSEAKDAVMAAFRRGETQVLVSTTVIEVGVDVPNASLMLVFNAERFGLAQLHQLRGRVGRGAQTSYCVLVCSEGAAEGFERLQILEKTRDGFAIAEADLKFRGPGEILGSKQSGLPVLRLGDLAADAPLVYHARALATRLLADDPMLSLPENTRFRALLHSPDARLAAN